jgi:hypothetical protein
MLEKARKYFFFEKKKQKTFAPLRAFVTPAVGVPLIRALGAPVYAFSLPVAT